MSGRADAVGKADSVTSAVSGGDSSPVGPASTGSTNRWPRKSYLELGALPTAVPCARLHARQVLWEWGLHGLAATVELLVSELVTNALRAMAGRDVSAPIRLQLSGDGARVLIEVWDAEPRPPVVKELGEGTVPDFGTEGGRGLFLVDALSERWNWYPVRQWGGKVVWAEVGP